MQYHISKFVDLTFDEAVARATAALKEHGFGILTTIDAQATLKEKLGVDTRPYLILGACNPPFAHRALELEDKIGTLMPCNVVVQQHTDGRIEVSAMNPLIMAQVADNPALNEIAAQVHAKISAAMDAI